jgi:phenylpyruvate tautomerase PptA (4-oxalocrotonate tautomerase family)
MPLVRISLNAGRSASDIKAISESVHRAMTETIHVPPDDRFQIITEQPAGGLVYDPSYLGIERTDGLVIIQITLNAGRTVELKKDLYKRLAELLARSPGVRPQDVLINLVEVPKENWSFGNGEAPYAPK